MDDQVVCDCGAITSDTVLEAETVQAGLGCFSCQYGGRIPVLPALFEVKTVTVNLPQGQYIVQGRFETVDTFETWASCLIRSGTVIHRSVDPNDETRMYLVLKAIMLGLANPEDPIKTMDHNLLEETYVRITRPEHNG